MIVHMSVSQENTSANEKLTMFKRKALAIGHEDELEVFDGELRIKTRKVHCKKLFAPNVLTNQS